MDKRARRLLLALSVGAAIAAACGIDDLLIGAPCNVDADCPNLSCVRTATEEAAGEPGLCSDSDTCVPGEQEGCQAASDGTCDFTLTAVDGPDGGRYCCGTGTNATVIGIAEDGTAECYDCPSCDFDEEPCLAGEARCIVEGDAPCGCRLPEGDLLNEACADDEDCGSLTCVRTLEQQAEPREATMPEQTIEDGNCRDDGVCAPGQRGCLVPTGVGCLESSDTVVADGTLEFCCPPSPDTNNFTVLLYDVSDDQREAACTFCARRACTSVDGTPNVVDQCTTISDPTCEVNAGELCGCPPT